MLSLNKFLKKQNLIIHTFGLLMCIVIFNGKLNLSIPDTGSLVLQQQDILDLSLDRSIDENSVEARKKFRWLYKKIELNIYDVFHFMGINNGKYPVLLHYSILMFLSLFLCSKIFEHILGKSTKNLLFLSYLSFFALYSFVLIITPMDEYFSFVEVFAIALAVYSSMKTNKILFFISIFLAVANRESGILISIIYVLFNHRFMSVRSMFYFLISPALLFAIINYDLLLALPQLAIYGNSDEYRPFLFNLESWTALPGEAVNYLLTYVSFLSPLVYLFVKVKPSSISKGVLLSTLVYTAIIFLGSFLGNFILLLLLIPFYMSVIALYLRDVVYNQ